MINEREASNPWLFHEGQPSCSLYIMEYLNKWSVTFISDLKDTKFGKKIVIDPRPELIKPPGFQPAFVYT